MNIRMSLCVYVMYVYIYIYIFIYVYIHIYIYIYIVHDIYICTQSFCLTHSIFTITHTHKQADIYPHNRHKRSVGGRRVGWKSESVLLSFRTSQQTRERE